MALARPSGPRNSRGSARPAIRRDVAGRVNAQCSARRDATPKAKAAVAVRAQDAPRATTARSETLRPGSYGVCAPGRSSGILERHRIRDPEDPDRRNDRKRGGRKTDHGSPVGTERGAGMGRSPRGRSAPSLIVTYPRMLISRLCAEEDRGKTPCTRARRRRTPQTAHAPGSGLLSSSLSAPRRGINTRHGVASSGAILLHGCPCPAADKSCACARPAAGSASPHRQSPLYHAAATTRTPRAVPR